jgi:glycosyltransferase involved in cell wall biosynthesis
MSLADGRGPVQVSVLVPAKDEAENLPEFVAQAATALAAAPFSAEVVVVDDGSVDATPRVLAQLQARHPFLRSVRHRTRQGIADALRTAGQAARGGVLVFYPADLQYLPADIPSLVAPILAGEADLVTGTKQGRYEKAFVSGVYNRLCRWLFGVRVTDLNSVKAYRREIMDAVPPRADWHRFFAVVASAEGFRLAERPVQLHPRRAGASKFGIGRIPVGVMDLVSVWFQLKYGRKPMLFFGVTGTLLFLLGFLAGVAALVIRFAFGVGFRPLLNLIETLVISGIALFGFGFIGEMMAGQREETRELRRELTRLRDERPAGGPADPPGARP